MDNGIIGDFNFGGRKSDENRVQKYCDMKKPVFPPLDRGKGNGEIPTINYTLWEFYE